MIEIALLLIAAYFVVGIYFVATSMSRGILADALFAVLWPVYLYQHLRHGR